MADYTVSNWSGYALYTCSHGDGFTTLSLSAMQAHQTAKHGAPGIAIGSIGVAQESPALTTISIEFPKDPPNPAIDGGHFERFASNPIITLPVTGKVATVNQDTGINVTTDVLTYTGDNPTNGNFYKLTTSGTIPTGFAINTIYYARDVDTVGKTMKLASTIGGAAVDITATGSGTLTITEYAWDRVQICGVVEDAPHGRLLLVVSGRRLNPAVIAAAGADYNDGRELFLYEQPWGQPGTVATPLNDATHPLVPVGAVGAWAATDWDSGSIYSGGHSCCIVGNRLHIAYGGAIISTTMSQYLGHNRIGLAYLDLTGSESNPVATKVTTAACLHLGTSPYQGCGPSLSYLNGKFHMWVNQAPMESDGTTAIDVYTNTLKRSVLPRLYTSQSFSTTVGTNGWACHPWMMEYGQNDSYQYNRGFQLMPYTSDGRKWLGMKYDPTSGTGGGQTIFMADIQSEQIEYTEMARVISINTVAGAPDSGTLDNPQFLYHLGKWYYYGSGNYIASNVGNQIISAEYVLTGTAEDQTGFTPSNTSYQRTIFDNTTSLSFTAGVAAWPNDTANSTAHTFKYVDRALYQIGGGILQGGATKNKRADGTTTANGKVQVKLFYPTRAHAHPAADTTAYNGTAGDTAAHTPQIIVTGKPI
ncbi:MAG: hypothetical protein ACYC5F_06170 [Thermoleophilia bacterium]